MNQQTLTNQRPGSGNSLLGCCRVVWLCSGVAASGISSPPSPASESLHSELVQGIIIWRRIQDHICTFVALPRDVNFLVFIIFAANSNPVDFCTHRFTMEKAPLEIKICIFSWLLPPASINLFAQPFIPSPHSDNILCFRHNIISLEFRKHKHSNKINSAGKKIHEIRL